MARYDDVSDIKAAGYRLCIFMHSGAYDRVHEAFSIVNVVLATGGEVHMLFTYGALKRLVKGQIDEMHLDGEPTPYAAELAKHLEGGAIESISEMLKTAKRLGSLCVYACSGAMAILNISREELIEEVDAVTGLVRFVALMKEADTTLYI